MLAKLSTIETIICLVIAAIFVIVCFKPGLEGFKNAVVANDLGPDTNRGITLTLMGAVISAQIISVGVASAGNVLQSKRASKVAIGIYVVAYGLLQIFFSICFFRLFPEIVNSDIPTLDIADASGSSFLPLAYQIMLVLAFLSTGPVYLFSLSDRWYKAGFWQKLKGENLLKKNEKVRFALVMVVVLGIGYAVANLGFRFIIVEIVPKQWVFYCVMLAIPMGIIAPLRVKRMRKELKETGHITTAAEKRAAQIKENSK